MFCEVARFGKVYLGRHTFFMRTGRISPVRCGLSVARYMYSQVGIITDYLGYDRDY